MPAPAGVLLLGGLAAVVAYLAFSGEKDEPDLDPSLAAEIDRLVREETDPQKLDDWATQVEALGGEAARKAADLLRSKANDLRGSSAPPGEKFPGVPDSIADAALALITRAADLCPSEQVRILSAGEAFAAEAPQGPDVALATLTTSLESICPALRTDPQNPYWREPAPGMPGDLYARYEKCMRGECSVGEMRALSQDLASFPDHRKDIDDFIAEAEGGEFKAPKATPDPRVLAQEIKRKATELGCLNLPPDLVEAFQRAAPGFLDNYEAPLGFYDVHTAIEVSRFVDDAPQPCRFPEFEGDDAMGEIARTWADTLSGLGARSPGWPQ